MKKIGQIWRTTSFKGRWFILLFVLLWLIGGTVFLRSPSGGSVTVEAAATTVLHFQGNTEDLPQGTGTANCAGNGAADVVNCDGPFLSESAVLSTNPSARWGPVNPAVNGTSARNIYDPNWVWYVSAPTRLGGPVTLEWWASCGGCAAGVVNANWTIKIYNSDATGAAPIFQTVVVATPSAPNVTEKLTANFSIPEINVASAMVLMIDPVFIDAQQNTNIYYDSQLQCTGAAGGVCDSTMTVQVFAPGEPIPTPTPGTGGEIPPPSACALPTYDNYQPPVNDPANPASPYPRRDQSGEPSIGVNWNTGNVMPMSRLRPNRVTFDDSTSPANPAENTGHKWFSRAIPTLVTGLDPILFTDSVTGRTIAGELQGAGGATNGVISDDDLATTVATFQTGGASQGFDHQSIGGGPPKPDIVGRQPTTSYPNIFYYASQQIGYASVATSFDGGLTYQPAVPAYTIAQCGGIHGHIKVAPDGTVYFPNKNCGGKAAAVVSEDNGLNWQIRPIPTSSSIGGISDPSLGVGADGRIYMSYTSAARQARVAVSDDRGLTWHDDWNLSAASPFPITGALFPAVVAGDNNRAAVFFLATTSTDPGDEFGSVPTVKATWYPYIATTCDGGKSWSVVRADNDPLNPGVSNPLQQGPVCTSGTTCPAGPPNTRNLLDFNDMTVDTRGRILAVYADGCNFGHPCILITDNSGDSSTNQGVARLTIIRQRGGMRLFSAFDPGGPAAPELSPPMFVEQQKDGYQVKWATPDDGGSPLLRYRIYRGKPGRDAKLIAEVKPDKNSYRDRRRRFEKNVYYSVTAVNRYGESPRNVKNFPQ